MHFSYHSQGMTKRDEESDSYSVKPLVFHRHGKYVYVRGLGGVGVQGMSASTP